MAMDDDRTAAFDPKRRLCPDGTCIGIIGPDGRCTECGTSSEGPPPNPEEEMGSRPSDALPSGGELDGEPGAGDEPGATFDPGRRLCGDGSCVGVIGQDNRCRVCGKPA
jgi:hypothetical protein